MAMNNIPDEPIYYTGGTDEQIRQAYNIPANAQIYYSGGVDPETGGYSWGIGTPTGYSVADPSDPAGLKYTNYDLTNNAVSQGMASNDKGGFLAEVMSHPLELAAITAAAIFAPELLPEITGIGGDATAAALATTGGEITPAVASSVAADAANAGLLSAGDYAAGQAATDAALANAGFDTTAAAAAPAAVAAPVTDQSAIQAAALPPAAPAPTTLADVANATPAAPAAATPATNTSLYDLANTQAAAPVAAPTVADTSTALTAPTSSTSLADMGGAQGVTAPSNFGTTAFANQAPTSLADMGGAQGITAGTTAGLAGMGGAQGIVAPTATALGDTSSFVNAANTAANQGLVNATGVTPVGSTTLGDTSSLVNAGTAGTVGAAASPVTSAISPAITDGTAAAGGGLLSNLSPLQMASLGSAAVQGIGGLLTGNAISSAQAQQQAAANQAQNTLSGIYSGLNQQIAPYQQTGQQGLTGLQNNLGYFQNQFNNQDLNAQLAPNYDFMLQQGQMANQRAANVGGGALSGNTLQGLNQYTQNYAQNAYQNAFNNYQTQRTGIYNSLAGIAGLGTSANQQAVAAGSQYGNQATNLATGIAAANAGATVGQAQNTSNTLSNLTNNLTLASLLGQKAG
jgi:hypothetical protein